MKMPTTAAIAKRDRLLTRYPQLKNSVGIQHNKLYMHNKKTGFNEIIDCRNATLTGRTPY